MRTAMLVACAAIATTLAPAAVAADCADPFADPDDILSLSVRISRADWDSLRDTDPVGQGCDGQYPYFMVEFRCGNEEPWISIGARRKRGDQRGKDTNEKPPMKLDFNRFVAGQRWPATSGNLGFRRLTLNNGQEDNPGGKLSALLTEHYAWRLMRAELPTAGRSAYARLSVQFSDDDAIEYHGLYILIEDIDRTALRARFGEASDQGTLLKTTTSGCRDQIVFDDPIAPNPARDAFDTWLGLNAGDFPGAWYQRTDEAIHLDELLRQEALRDVLANGADTKLGGNDSNYYSWDSASDTRRRYLPWDLDDVFRPFPQDVAFTFPLEGSCSQVGNRTRCEDEIGERYLTVACQLANGTLAEEKLAAEFAAIDALIRPIIADEIALVWAGIDSPLDDTVPGTYASEFNRLQDWIANRIPEVRRQIEARGVSCPDACVETEPEPCQFLECAGERRCEAGRWTTCLVDPDLEIPMNGVDDDCDRLVDETDPELVPDAGPEPDAPGDAGCCSASGSSPSDCLLTFLLAALLWRRRAPRSCSS